MTSILKYRIIGLTLAVIFAVFNIGLPIVVASCLMMKYSDSKQCMMCDDGSSSRAVKFTRTIDKSCCATTFATDRNKTEFLQSKAVDRVAQPVCIQIISSVSTYSFPSLISRLQFVNSSPPPTRDIPIFISSLLI